MREERAKARASASCARRRTAGMELYGLLAIVVFATILTAFYWLAVRLGLAIVGGG